MITMKLVDSDIFWKRDFLFVAIIDSPFFGIWCSSGDEYEACGLYIIGNQVDVDTAGPKPVMCPRVCHAGAHEYTTPVTASMPHRCPRVCHTGAREYATPVPASMPQRCPRVCHTGARKHATLVPAHNL